MDLKVLRQGSRGEAVELLQAYLRGQGHYSGVIDGHFGPMTHEAVCAFQRSAGLTVDGVVGNQTWGALMSRGVTVLPSDAPPTDTTSPNWPPRPAGVTPLSAAERSRVFGSFEFRPDPQPGNPEAIRITSRSADFRLVEVSLPQLVGVTGFPRSGKVPFHAKGADQLQALVTAWDRAGLLARVRSWAGTYVPRFVRGSRTSLSNHAWGTAFDINAAWNGLGVRPALVGQHGCVRELVALAVVHGFYWGGWFGRPDGMHFELREAK
jgi:hypothetical protein